MQTRIQNPKKIGIQAATVALAVTLAVALPQLCHAVGLAVGAGSGVGEMLLPMQLPVLVAGFLAGPLVGVLAGLISPLLSFAISGMPSAVMLPLIVAELVGYGLAAGWLKNNRLPLPAKLLIVQVAGRLLRAGATLLAVYAFGSAVPVSSIWMSVWVGLPGIVLQWALVPLLMRALRGLSTHYE